jgi:hypothetical protein
MACYETGTVVSLHRHEAITLPDVRGATLQVTRGDVWVTEEHKARDIVLRSGDAWLVESDGRTVVEAQNDAVFCIVGRAGAKLRLPAAARPRAGLLTVLAGQFNVRPRQVPYY